MALKPLNYSARASLWIHYTYCNLLNIVATTYFNLKREHSRLTTLLQYIKTMTAELSRKAQEAAAAALATPFARRISEGIASVTNKKCDNSEGFAFLDSMCGPMMDKFRNAGDEDDDDDSVVHGGRGGRGGDRGRSRRSGRRPQSSYDYGDDETEYTDDDYDDDTYDDGGTPRKRRGGRRGRGHSRTDDESSYTTGYTGYTDDDTFDNNTYGTRSSASRRRDDDTYDSAGKLIQKPLASGFAKRCYFTKAGIGRNTQHYEGLTLTGNTILMLASAMKMKGCPTICDEDLRTVEQTFPNQFSRLPDELLLSSGWRRISKYCHFSHKPLPDGVPFFHSRKRCHPNGGFYFLLCSAVGMVRNIDVEPLSRDALVLLQTDFPLTCEKAPQFLVEDPSQWTLVNKFCYFSGGPINVEEDVYYKADLGGNEICMLAFLSPNLTPEELYRLKESPNKKPGEEENTGPLKSVKAVEEVESVYNLTNQDFDDLKLYHLGPCRALPPHLLTPDAWTKVLPPPFATAREEALMIAQDWESRFPPVQPAAPTPAPIEEKKVENITSGYVEFGETAQMKQPTLSQDPSENYNQQPQMQLQHMQSGSSHEYPTQYPSKQIQQPMGQEQHNYSQQYPAQVHQINGIMRDPNGQYQPQATFPAQYPPHQLSSALQASTDHISPQGNMPQLEMEVANAHPPTDPNNFVREVEEGTGWDQP